ncbi:hypothetical protein Tco_1485315 [Tanacetum coccineum]
MTELVRFQICKEIDDTSAWVSPGLERQPGAAAGTPKAAEDAHVADEGDQAVPTPVQAPQLPPPASRPSSGLWLRDSCWTLINDEWGQIHQLCRLSDPVCEDIAAKKSTMLVKYVQSRNLEVLES